MEQAPKLRILMIAPANSIHTLRWMQFLINSNCEICLVSSHKLEFELSEIQYHFIPFHNYYISIPKLLFKIHKISQAFKPDVIQVHYHTYLGWIPGLLNLKPLIITLWGSDILKNSSILAKCFMRLSFKRAELVTGDGLNMLTKAQKMGAKKTDLLLFGVDKKSFYPISDKHALRKEFGLQLSDFVVLSPRALQSTYQIEMIIHACAELNLEQKNSIQLLILEYAPDNDYRTKIVQLVDQLNAHNWVHFLSSRAHNHLNNIYNVSNLIISVPTSDGTPVTFLEAMACGIPIISNRHQAYDGIFEENIHLVYCDEKKSLSKQILNLKNNSETYETLRHSGLKLATQYSQLSEMNRMLKFYRQLSHDRANT